MFKQFIKKVHHIESSGKSRLYKGLKIRNDIYKESKAEIREENKNVNRNANDVYEELRNDRTNEIGD